MQTDLLRAFALIKEEPTLPPEVAIRLSGDAPIPPVSPLELLRYAALGYRTEQL